MITAMEDAVRQGVTPSSPATFGYYRQPNGWITVSPMTELDQLNYIRQGWEPLEEYGNLEMNTEYTADHPLEALFQRGGAHELPVEQVIEMALHLSPPLVPTCNQILGATHKRHKQSCWKRAQPVSFPQLEEIPEGFQCRFCERDPFPIDKARDQHEGVMHKDEKSDIRTGTVLAENLVRGLKGESEKRLPFACGLCTKSYRHAGRLKTHVEKEHGEEKD